MSLLRSLFVPDLISFLLPSDPNERCGLILADDTVVEIRNVHGEPEKGYRMDAKEVLPHVDNIKATWHTHPLADPNLSEEDYAGFLQWPNLVHYIVGIRDGEPAVGTYTVEDGYVLSQ